jgi:hypothetical protein
MYACVHAVHTFTLPQESWQLECFPHPPPMARSRRVPFERLLERLQVIPAKPHVDQNHDCAADSGLSTSLWSETRARGRRRQTSGEPLLAANRLPEGVLRREGGLGGVRRSAPFACRASSPVRASAGDRRGTLRALEQCRSIPCALRVDII